MMSKHSIASLTGALAMLLGAPHAEAAFGTFIPGWVEASSPLAACKLAQQHVYPTVTVFVEGIYLVDPAGQTSSYQCKWRHPQGTGTLSTYAQIMCPTGQRKDMFAANGCVPAEPVPLRPDSCAGNPLNIIDGSKTALVTDVTTAGPRPLAFTRSYNSVANGQGSRLGTGWRTHYDGKLIKNSASNPTIIRISRPNGVEAVFKGSGSTWTPAYWTTVGVPQYSIPRTDVSWTLAVVGTNWKFTDENDTVETYDTNGRLVSIRERDGYEITLAYDAAGKNTSLTDSFGRQLTFTYYASGRLETVTTPDGKVHRYTYLYKDAPGIDDPNQVGGNWVLEKVIYPDNTPGDDTDNPSVRYHYESTVFPKLLTGVTDERGVRYATWAYDANGRATLSKHAGDVDQSTVAYDDVAKTRTVTNPLAKQAVYHLELFQGTLRLKRLEGKPSPNCPAADTFYAYNTNGFLSSTTDGEGRITQYVRDSRGLATQITEAASTPLARVTSQTWHATFRLPTQIAAPRRTIDLTYDASGRLLTRQGTDTTTHSVPYSTNGQTRSWTYTYTPSGLLLETVNGPRTDVGDTTSYQYTASSYLSRITNAVGHQINVTVHDGMGRPLSATDGNGIVTELQYNARGWLTHSTVKHASGDAVTQIEYSAAGDVTKVTLPDGSFLTYAYSDARRLTAITNQIGEKIELTYDLMGNVTQQVTKDTGGTVKRTQNRAYDELGRLLRLIGAATQTTQFGYDKTDNLTAVTDALNKATSFGIDALSRTTTATNPLMGVRTTGYDLQDNVVSESDERTIATSYVLNGFAEAIQEASPDGGTIVYVRDSAGNITQKTDARGQVVQMSYDALNRATAATFSGATAFNITYGYDATAGGNFGIGRLTSVADTSGTTAIRYDHRGNQVREDRTLGGVLYTTQYAWSLADNLAELVYPSGRILTFARDALGRVTAVTTKNNAGAAAVNVATAIAWMPFGPIASLTHGNTLAATLTWDQDYRLGALKTELGATKIQDLAYGFNLDDNVTAITDNLAAGRNQSFTLDDLQRLTAATGAYGSLSYSYDAADNRLTRNLSGGPSATYTYGTTNNRLQSLAVTGQPARNFTHDNAGNITLDHRGAGNTITITVGADNRPQTVTVAGAGATSVTYKHNAFGERVSRVEGAATAHFHYDRDGRLIAESDGAGVLVREYLWLGDKPLGLVVGPAGSPTLYFVHADHLERVQKITDASRTIVWDGQFTPYGRTHSITGTITNPLRFPGQWADPAAGYFYNYLRDYDPTLARYLAVDPLRTGGGRNKFTYAGANPQNLVDPTGEVVPAFLFAAGFTLATHFALEYAIQSFGHALSGSGEPFSFDWRGALCRAPLSLTFGLAAHFARFGPLAAGILGPLAARAALGPAAGPLAWQGGNVANVFKQLLASESGAVHLNSLAYTGETIVYRILNTVTGETIKYGITSRLPVVAGTLPSRVTAQVSQLGATYKGEVLATMPTRAEARALEKLLNIDAYIVHGRLPPGGKYF